MMTGVIPYYDLKRVNALHGDEIREAVDRVLSSGWFLHGEETRLFEMEYSRYIGTRHTIGCGNGLDALTLIFRAYIALGRMHPGDEVIVPANTFVASLLAVSQSGLTPVPVDSDPDTLLIDPSRIISAITPRTKALMIVHLYGRCAYTGRIGDICRDNGLLLVEDNAQAHGCLFNGRRTGSLGDAAAHSFYPAKNLGASGDGGGVTTDDNDLAGTIREIANYGSSEKYIHTHKGMNSRLDEVQAAVLRAKLRHLDAYNRQRAVIAGRYTAGIDNPLIKVPGVTADGADVFHIFPIFCDRRDSLAEYLANNGIRTQIHYPVPPHRQECYRELSRLSLPVTEKIHATELSLPISPAMTEEETDRIISCINSWV